MSAVTTLIADIESFRTTHGHRPRRIRMHPFDVNELLNEIMDAHETVPAAEPSDTPPANPDWAMSFMGIPVYRAWDAVVARPWLDV